MGMGAADDDEREVQGRTKGGRGFLPPPPPNGCMIVHINSVRRGHMSAENSGKPLVSWGSAPNPAMGTHSTS